MACGCQKNKVATGTTVTANVQRVTVYQVLDSSGAVADSSQDLATARAKAVEIGGRVRVTSQQA